MPNPFQNHLSQAVADPLVARLLLLVNHVIASEDAARLRLQAHAGSHMALRFTRPTGGALVRTLGAWLPTEVRLAVTPAGLLELVPTQASEGPEAQLGLPPGSLSVTVPLPEPLAALRMAVRRERPEVNIEGDAAFAETLSWLMKHLRWDVGDDLARWLGNTPSQLLKAMADNVRAALARWRPGMPGRPSR